MSFDVFLECFDEAYPYERWEAVRDGVYRKLEVTRLNDEAIFLQSGAEIEFLDSSRPSPYDGRPPSPGGGFILRNFPDGLSELIFELLYEAKLVLLPSMDGNYFIVADESAEVPEVIAENDDDAWSVILVRSPSELKTLLTEGYDAWFTYAKPLLEKTQSALGAKPPEGAID